jgi:hypothetical protein
MPHIAHDTDRDFSAGYLESQTLDRAEMRRLASDRNTWGEPPSYGALLSNSSAQLRIAQLIARSVTKRSRHRAW